MMVLSERHKQPHRKSNLKNQRDSKVSRHFRCCFEVVFLLFFLLHKSECEGKHHMKHGHRTMSSP